MVLKPHTCSEWVQSEDKICGKPAPYHLRIDQDGIRFENYKCRWHIRRYMKDRHTDGTKVTITAMKEAKK